MKKVLKKISYWVGVNRIDSVHFYSYSSSLLGQRIYDIFITDVINAKISEADQFPHTSKPLTTLIDIVIENNTYSLLP